MKTCSKCKKAHSASTARCGKCCEKKRQANRRRRERLIAAGVCPECGRPRSDQSKKLCITCRDKGKVNAAQRRVECKDRGLCVRCGELSLGYKYCKPCRKLAVLWNNKRREELIREGRCVNCYVHVDIPDNKYCSRCVVKATARMWLGSAKKVDQLFVLLESQKGVCPYTGEAITPGVNAEIDHRIPRKKGGSNELGNLQWTSKVANRAKQDMTHDEFIGMCRLIVARFPE